MILWNDAMQNEKGAAESMNRLEELAAAKFEGDQNKALEYIYTSGEISRTEEREIYNDMTYDQQSEALRIWELATIDYPLTHDQYDSDWMLARRMDMSFEEIKTATSNPYKSRVIQQIKRILLLIAATVAAFTYTGQNELYEARNIVAIVVSMASMIMCGNLGLYVNPLLDFKNLQKRLNESWDQYKSLDDLYWRKDDHKYGPADEEDEYEDYDEEYEDEYEEDAEIPADSEENE